MFIQKLKPLTNYEIKNLAKELRIKHFAVFIRDTLPSKINDVEYGAVNLDISKNNGTRWVCYYCMSDVDTNNKDNCYYFDHFY